MVFHVGNRHIGSDHLCHLTRKTARRIDDDFCRDLAQLCVDLPLAGGQTIDIRHAVMAHNFDAHVGGAASHRVGEPRRISVAIVQCPRACYDAIDVVKRIECFNLCRVDDLHVETDIVSDTFHVMKPVDIGLLTRDTNASRRMPTHILAGLFFQSRVETIPVVVDLGEIVVTHQTRALTSSMPSRP